MRLKLLILTLFVLTLISSCQKDPLNSNKDIIGNWTWKSSMSSEGFQMLSTDTTKIFSIQLKSDYRFINQATCIIGAQMEGNYQVQKFGYERILILKKENIKPDTLRLSIVADKLTLTEIYNGYAWSHYFNKN